MVAYHLPARRAQGQGGLAKRAGHGAQGLLRGDDDDGKIKSAEREAPGHRGSAPAPGALTPNARTNSARPRMPYTIDGTPARLAMFVWMIRRKRPGGAYSSR